MPIDQGDAIGHATPGPTLPVVAAAVLFLVLLACICLASMAPPAPVPASAASTLFSAERALAHLPRIAAKPHPIGSPANADTRAYLVEVLKGLGYEVQTQTELAISQDDSVIGLVNNVVARSAGSGGGQALMLSAHYDSVPTGPGAADNGAAVAAVLETLRALQAAPRSRDGLIVLFTDGEEAGLLGAEAFIARHPWAKDVAMVLNFEYRGNSGPTLMFETSSGNGKLVSAFSSVPRPLGTSLMYEIYLRMPNRTDFTVFKRAGIAGMNFAAIENFSSYHTELDRIEGVDGRSVQHQGETMLALTRHLSDADLNGFASSDRVYFDLPGLGIVNYESWVAWVLTALVVAVSILVVAAGVKLGRLRLVRMGGGALVLLCTGMLLALCTTVLLLVIRSMHPDYRGLSELYNHQWYWLAFVILTLGAFSAIYKSLNRWFRPMELSVGAALVWIVLLLCSTWAMPGSSFIFAWPLAATLPVWLYLLSAGATKRTANHHVVVLVVSAVPAVVLFTPLVYLLLVALTTPLAGVAVFAVVLLLGILWPLLALLHARFPVHKVAAVVGVGFLVVGGITAGASPDHPHPVNVFYVKNGNTGTAQWLSGDVVLDAWQKNFFDSASVRRKIPEWYGAESRSYWTSSAPDFKVPPPAIETLGDETRGATRTIELRLKSNRGARDFNVHLIGSRVGSASVKGQSLPTGLTDDWRLAAYNLPAEGIDIRLEVTAGQPFTINLFDITHGLPGTDLVPRGKKTIAHRSETSDTTQSLATSKFN